MKYIDFYRIIINEDGRQFHGDQGAGCLFFARDTRRFLIAKRSRYVNEPGTWGVWGGAIENDEDPKDAAQREAFEECGYRGNMKLFLLDIYKNGSFKYYNYLAVVDNEFTPRLQWETDDYEWTEFGKWPTPLHFGLKHLLNVKGENLKLISRSDEFFRDKI